MDFLFSNRTPSEVAADPKQLILFEPNEAAIQFQPQQLRFLILNFSKRNPHSNEYSKEIVILVSFVGWAGQLIFVAGAQLVSSGQTRIV